MQIFVQRKSHDHDIKVDLSHLTDTKYIYIETLLHGMSELLWDCTRDRNNLKLYLLFIIIYTHFLNV